MKKRIVIIAVSVLLVLVVAGCITNYADSARVTTNHEPKFCIKTVNDDGSKVTYWGLGYKVIRYVGVSPNEPYQNNIGAKMGSWFMQYELPEAKTIKAEVLLENKEVEITDRNDVGTLENLLLYSKYDSDPCKGINTYKITLDNKVYYIKADCKEISNGEKQAKLTEEDLATIERIIAAH